MLRCVLAVLFVFSAAAAADDGLTPEQKRMRACNTQAKAKDLEGPERSRFLSHCLNGHDGSPPKPTAHQEKNESCTKRADERRLEGAERRGFMSDCIKPERTKQQAGQRRLEGEEKEKFVARCLEG